MNWEEKKGEDVSDYCGFFNSACIMRVTEKTQGNFYKNIKDLE